MCHTQFQTCFNSTIPYINSKKCVCVYVCVCVCVCAQSLQSYSALCNPMDCNLPGSSVHGDSPDKNTGVGCYAPLQGIFLTQEPNQHL